MQMPNFPYEVGARHFIKGLYVNNLFVVRTYTNDCLNIKMISKRYGREPSKLGLRCMGELNKQYFIYSTDF